MRNFDRFEGSIPTPLTASNSSASSGMVMSGRFSTTPRMNSRCAALSDKQIEAIVAYIPHGHKGTGISGVHELELGRSPMSECSRINPQ